MLLQVNKRKLNNPQKISLCSRRSFMSVFCFSSLVFSSRVLKSNLSNFYFLSPFKLFLSDPFTPITDQVRAYSSPTYAILTTADTLSCALPHGYRSRGDRYSRQRLQPTRGKLTTQQWIRRKQMRKEQTTLEKINV